MIKVMIADDQELIRQSLQIVLSTHEDLKIVDAVENGFAVLESIKKERPDVILMDIQILKSLSLPLLMMMNLSLVL